MLFNSAQFLVFFPVVTLIFFAIPKKVRYIWLLISSYYFYMCWNAKYAMLLLLSTVITYTSGILISKSDTVLKKKIWVGCSFGSNLLILAFFKYFNFFLENLNLILNKANIRMIESQFDIILPVGISFYTFQALSYTMDVYREDLKAEKNFAKYALFVSFFPQLVAGPIERSTNLIHQINDIEKNSRWDGKRSLSGLLQMIWGFFLKLVVADRLAILVNEVFNNYENYKGFQIIVAAIFFAFQIYCDFNSYSNIAIGCARIYGIDLMKNFDTPYFSQSIAEFWRRWHISLSSWFRDYLYIPLGGNRKGTVRKYINILIVFLVSGLWHGASWNYVIWGGIHGIYQIIGKLLMPIRNWIVKHTAIDRESWTHKLYKIVCTFVLVDFAWIFFRADSATVAVRMIKSIFSSMNLWIFFDGEIYNLGLGRVEFGIAIFALLIVLFVSCIEKKVKIYQKFCEQRISIQISMVFVSIIIILVYGIYGPSYDASQFIYFQF